MLYAAVSILVSVLGTASLMFLREANKRAQAKEAKEEEDELLEELGSSMDELDNLDD